MRQILDSDSSSSTPHDPGRVAGTVNYLEVVAACAVATTDNESEGDQQAADLTLHALGHCRPCHYMSRKHGCLAGEACEFCHEDHDGMKRSRPSKAKRRQVKRVLDKVEKLRETQPGQFEDLTGLLAERNGYLRSVLRGREAAKRKGCDITPISQNNVEMAHGHKRSPSDHQGSLHEAHGKNDPQTSRRPIGTLEKIVRNYFTEQAGDSGGDKAPSITVSL